jgi:hypothetical protein
VGVIATAVGVSQASLRRVLGGGLTRTLAGSGDLPLLPPAADRSGERAEPLPTAK